MTAPDPIVIVGAARTPMGGFQGALKDVPAPGLGGAAIRAALDRAGVEPGDAGEVLNAIGTFYHVRADLEQALG